MEQKLVVHKKDGTIHKGITQDFDPATDAFHFLPGEGGGIPMRMQLEEMKALFWVKDYIGNRQFVPTHDFDTKVKDGQRKIVTFKDGEEIWGTVEGKPDGPRGFFLIPADSGDNNVRIYVVRSAIKDTRPAT